jgi:hypothetical protein
MRYRASITLAALAATMLAMTAPTSGEGQPPASENDRQTELLLKSIAGKEKLPAEQVFKNVQVMKGVPAERFLRVMNFGYSKSLGINCSHCHVDDDWASDEKRPKLAAREMILFTRETNAKLRDMKHLDTAEPIVNCTTCHRGSLEPATNLDK